MRKKGLADGEMMYAGRIAQAMENNLAKGQHLTSVILHPKTRHDRTLKRQGIDRPAASGRINSDGP